MRTAKGGRIRVSSSLGHARHSQVSRYVYRVTEKCSQRESVEFLLAVDTFKSYVAGQYQTEAAKNTGDQFLSQLFKAVSLQRVDFNPLHYVILASILIEVDFCPKFTKVNRILREIVQIPESTDPTVFFYLEKIMQWMTRPLGASLHTLLLPLRDRMLFWFKSEDEDMEISGLYLLQIFIRRFPSYLGPLFESAKVMILKALNGTTREMVRAAVRVTKSALDLLDTPFSLFVVNLLQTASTMMCDIKNPVSELFIEAVYSIVKDSRALPLIAPKKVPMYVFVELSDYHLLDIIHITYLCCPDLFTGEHFKTIFDEYKQLVSANIGHIDKKFVITLKSLGTFCFSCCTLIQNQFSQEVGPLKSAIRAQLEIPEAKYAFLSLMSPKDSDCDKILELIIDAELNQLILKGLGTFCRKWPAKGPLIKAKLVPYLCTMVLEGTEEEAVIYALKSMKSLDVTQKELKLNALLQIAKGLQSPSIQIRYRTAMFLVSQQVNFPKITVKLLTWIGTEVNNDLRLKILKLVSVDNRYVSQKAAGLIFGLIEERDPRISHAALELLMKVKLSRRVFSDYLSEIVTSMTIMEDDSEVAKDLVTSLLIIVKAHGHWVKPYAGFLVERVLQLQPQKSCSLLLLSHILRLAVGENLNGQIPQIVNHLTMGLSKHVTVKRLSTALDLMKSALRYTSLVQVIKTEYPNLLNRVFELACSEMAPEVSIKLLAVMERLGPVTVADLQRIARHHHDDSPSTSSLISAFVLTKSKPTINRALTSLTSLSVVRSLCTILDIIDEDTLIHLRYDATETLLEILSDYKDWDAEVMDMILEKVGSVVVNGGARTLGLVVPLLTCFGSKVEPMLPPIINLISENWDKLDLSVLLKTVQWISVQIPDVFIPHVLQVVSLVVNSLSMPQCDCVSEIFVTFASLRSLMRYVDFLVVPAILSWLEINCQSTDITNDALICFKAILMYCRSNKFCSGIIRTLLMICEKNHQLKPQVFEIIMVLAVQMRDGLVVYLQEISHVFDVSDNDEFNMIKLCIRHGQRLPAALVNKYDYTRRQPKQREPVVCHRRQDSADRLMMTDLPKFERPSDEWDEFQWDNWYEETVSSFISFCPSKAISCCAVLAKSSAIVRNMIFPVAYALYAAIDDECERILISVLKLTIAAKNARSNIVRSFLSVVELLEINRIDIRVPWSQLAARATETGLYPQALRYHEYDFRPDKQDIAESLIMLNLRLGLRLAANGIFKCAHVKSEKFEECLGLWENVLNYWEEQLKTDPENSEFRKGKMKALDKLCRYHDLADFCKESEPSTYAASAAFHVFDHTRFCSITANLQDQSYEADLYRAIGAILNENYTEATRFLDSWNASFASHVYPMNLEDYQRMAGRVTEVAVFSELYDVIELRQSASETWSAVTKQRERAEARASHIMSDWLYRFDQINDSPKHMFDALCIRSLALSEEQLTPFWLQFIDKEMVNGRTQMLNIALSRVDRALPEVQFIECVLKRNVDGQAQQALDDLSQLVSRVQDRAVLIRCLSQLSEWYEADNDIQVAYQTMKRVIDMKPETGDIWKKWAKLALAMFDFDHDEKYLKLALRACLSGLNIDKTVSFALLILSICVNYESPKISKTLQDGFRNITPEIWISLLPQITSMLKKQASKPALAELLLNIAQTNPKTIVYSLMPSLMAKEEPELQNKLAKAYPRIVTDAIRFSTEMVRIGSTWWETWYTAIDDTSKRFVYYNDPQATVKVLLPLHKMVEQKAESFFEFSFIAQLGPEAVRASEYLQEFAATNNIMYFNQAWTIYVSMFKKIKGVKDLTEVKLDDVSPWLAQLSNSSLMVPGMGMSGGESLTIDSVAHRIPIIRSKQKPRRVDMVGSDGHTYNFLLKANEDTRLDERVMQLFDFITSSIAKSAMPFSQKLSITTYRVLPLTYKVGLIGWVPNTQTLLEIIRQYRTSNNVVLEVEKMRTYVVEPRYDRAPLEKKIHAFQMGLDVTAGDDLQKVILCYSTDCNDWLNRRINFTASLAVTSMAGYILGLGDRHVCNIMMNTRTARLVHIDFGDSFEVAMNRQNWPEKVPFRLTRMMVKALEVSRIEGTLRTTMENVMGLLRSKGDQILALISAWMCSPVEQMLDKEDAGKMYKMSKRIEDKLKGTDFATPQPLSVSDQVDRLISEAMDISNLAQMFTGWYPWW